MLFTSSFDRGNRSSTVPSTDGQTQVGPISVKYPQCKGLQLLPNNYPPEFTNMTIARKSYFSIGNSSTHSWWIFQPCVLLRGCGSVDCDIHVNITT